MEDGESNGPTASGGESSASASERAGAVTSKGFERSEVSASSDTIRAGNLQGRAPSLSSVLNIDEDSNKGVGAEDKANGSSDGVDTSVMKPAFFLPNEGKANMDTNVPPRYPNFKSMPRPQSIHKRNVSWGMPEVLSDANTHGPPVEAANAQGTNTDGSVEGIQQLFLDGAPVSSVGGERVLYSSENKPKSNGKIDADDIIYRSPMEAEAETYILRALEERDTSRAEADPSEPRVLGNISDEAIKNLASESRVADANSTASTNQFYDQMSTTRRQRPTHRRSETVEQKLAGLADAIDAFHNMDIVVPEYELPPSPLGRGRLNSVDAGDMAGLELPFSAAEKLQQNASILLNRGKKKDGDTGAGAGTAVAPVAAAGTGTGNSDPPSVASSQPSTASSRWHKLRHVVTVMNVALAKKHDDGASIEGGPGTLDEEIGRNSDHAIFMETISEHDNSGKNSSDHAPNVDRLGGTYKPFFKELEEFFGPRRTPIFLYCRVMVLYVFIPVIGVAAILFHLAENPPTGILKNNGRAINGTLINEDGKIVDPGTASASWWLLFIGVRQLITLTLSKAVEIFVVDFLSIRTRFTIRLFGPWITLFILQARGWPFLLFVWAVFDFGLLSGTKRFFAHWLYWQNFLKLFNESNPSGNVVDSEWNHRILAIAASVGAVVAIKRFWMGQFLGRQTFSQYADKLAIVMKKILLISQVASLGRDFEKYVGTRGMNVEAPHVDGLDELDGLMNYSVDDSSVDGRSFGRQRLDSSPLDDQARVIDPNDRNPLTGSLDSSQKIRIAQLLGAWEEPLVGFKPTALASVDSILQFRRALSLLKTNYPFSALFGLADTRENCIESAQEVYDRLLLRTPNSVLSFEVLALLGVNKDGSLDQVKLRELVRLFRPDRDGTLSLLDFVKSIDSVYKELRLLRAAVANSSKIDQAFESILNIVFYVVVLTIILSQLGLDPLALFLSVSGVVLAFAFMIGSASSKYFEGLLFILVRRPYAIGDGIHVSNIEADTSYTGSAWWTVEDITLFTTSVVFMFTNERATLSNGSLANSRIINSSRSPQAYVYILLKFPVDVPYDKLEVFHTAIEKYIRNRPREWLALSSFRATCVEADRGFIEYLVCGQHREGWNSWGAIMLSKAHLANFSLELTKKLDIRFTSPPLPVDLSIVQPGNAMDPTSILNSIGGVPGTGGANQSLGSQATMSFSPDLASLQAKFAPAQS